MPDSRRIILSTFGSLGDLHPYLAIALELKAMGHLPVLATSEFYREKVEGMGLELAAVRPDVADFHEDRGKLMAEAMHPVKGPEFVIRRGMMPHLEATFTNLRHVCEGQTFSSAIPSLFPPLFYTSLPEYPGYPPCSLPYRCFPAPILHILALCPG